MKIQYASDLHLEFKTNYKFASHFDIIEPIGDILVLAGDIMNFKDKKEDFLKWCSLNFKDTYWVPGNHEYYGADILKYNDPLNEKIYHNVHLVNNVSLDVEGVHLVFSTMWTKIEPQYAFLIQERMSDFHAIKYGGVNLNVDRYNILHNKCYDFLLEEIDNLKDNKDNTVFITHHVPTYGVINPNYKGDILNEAFHFEFMNTSTLGPKYWIYGHNHYNTENFKLFDTTFVSNQLGYVQSNEHKTFSNNKIIEI